MTSHSIVADAEPDFLERLRRQMASGWVEELVVEGGLPAGAVARAVQAGRETGRTVRVVGAQRAMLQPARAGERWVPVPPGNATEWRLTALAPSPWTRWAKRAIDVVGASLLLLVLSPLLLILALAVRLSSPGPVLYTWRVRGRHGRPITGYKFRTMVPDADRRKPHLLQRNEMVGPVFKLSRDPRITPLGRWLRRYSLDELPQLISVIKGDMSLVGPRPVLRDEYQAFELWQMRKLSVTPGMTCLWQSGGRNTITDFDEWARLDLDYIDHWSLGLDLRILLRTATAVVRGTGR
jgi:lipopolysaccharide/colanic/teichoic acid biosynthesis glycosyltransferase